MIKDITEVSWPGWETVRVLGHGSFGAVYEIQRDMLGETEKAALKVISIPQNQSEIQELYNDGYDDESVAETFKAHLKTIVNEYSLMRRLNECSNVVHCDDVRYEKKADGIGWDIYIKMELLIPMAQALPEEIPEKTVIRVAKEMCNALSLCEKQNIIHRDIKPQNMFMTPNGTCKLGDFGIAKTVEKTMGGTKIGTFKYMAPEVYNNQPYGAASDLYSLGLVLYWMLNHRRMPFMPLPPAKALAGMDGDAANRRLMGEPIPAPATGSEELKKIVLKACAYAPKDRYKTADEMLEALEKIGQKPVPVVTARPAPAPVVPTVQNQPVTETVQVRKTEPTPESTVRVRQATPAPRPAAPAQPKPIAPRPVTPPPEPPKSDTPPVEDPIPKVKKGLLVILLISLVLLIGGVLIVRYIVFHNDTSVAEENAATKINDSLPQSKRPDNTDFANVSFLDVEIGDTISIGYYEQDNVLSNGAERIEWKVLDIQDGRALVISEYVLDCQPYNGGYEEITWETSSLRKWLNEDFINAAFTSGERARISTTHLSADNNATYGTNAGKTTLDQVYLLSKAELQEYIDILNDRACKPTEYAKSKGLVVYSGASSEYSNNVCWLLRSPGKDGTFATTVSYSGWIDDYGELVTTDYGVRPAMWISLEGYE